MQAQQEKSAKNRLDEWRVEYPGTNKQLWSVDALEETVQQDCASLVALGNIERVVCRALLLQMRELFDEKQAQRFTLAIASDPLYKRGESNDVPLLCF